MEADDAMGDKKGFLLYRDQRNIFESLPDEQAGQIIKAICKYADGEEPKLNGLLYSIFLIFRNRMDEDQRKYIAICERNQRNGSLGGRPRETQANPGKPNESERFPGKPKKPDTDTDTETETERDIKTYAQTGNTSESLAVKTAAGAGESKPASPSKTLIDQRFDTFWKAYPKKRNKESARKAWRKISPTEDLCKAIVLAVERAKKTQDWQKDRGQFIPYPAKWLNNGAWEDEIGEEEINGQSKQGPAKGVYSGKYAHLGTYIGQDKSEDDLSPL